MQPANYNMQAIVRGDALVTDVFQLRFDEEPLDTSMWAIRAWFTRVGDSQPTVMVEKGRGIVPVTITQGDAFLIGPLITTNWQHGTYTYDIEFERGGVKRTYIKGTIKLQQDTTK